MCEPFNPRGTPEGFLDEGRARSAVHPLDGQFDGDGAVLSRRRWGRGWRSHPTSVIPRWAEPGAAWARPSPGGGLRRFTTAATKARFTERIPTDTTLRNGSESGGLTPPRQRRSGQPNDLTFFTIAAASIPYFASNSSALPECGNSLTAILWTLIPSMLNSPATASPNPPSA